MLISAPQNIALKNSIAAASVSRRRASW